MIKRMHRVLLSVCFASVLTDGALAAGPRTSADAVTADVMRHYAFSASKLAEDVAKAAVNTGDDRK